MTGCPVCIYFLTKPIREAGKDAVCPCPQIMHRVYYLSNRQSSKNVRENQNRMVPPTPNQEEVLSNFIEIPACERGMQNLHMQIYLFQFVTLNNGNETTFSNYYVLGFTLPMVGSEYSSGNMKSTCSCHYIKVN